MGGAVQGTTVYTDALDCERETWAQVDPYPDEDDWYSRDVSIHPLQSGPEPKRRFIPSKWEEKKYVYRYHCVCYVHCLRMHVQVGRDL